MLLKTLIENTVDSQRTDLTPQHGMSIYIEENNKKILFDMGKNGVFISNAEKMGIDLSSIDYAVISHGHYDHSGGLKYFLESNSKAKVILSEACRQEEYISIIDGIEHPIGIDRSLFMDYEDRFIWVENDYVVLEGMHIMSNIEQTEFVPLGNNVLYKKVKDQYFHDNFKHELILVFKEDEGDIILTGCSHSGITNMLKTYKKVFSEGRIKALIGGFHLMNPGTRRIQESSKTVDSLGLVLTKYNIGKIYTGHCTGEEAFQILSNRLGNNISRFQAGSEITIS